MSQQQIDALATWNKDPQNTVYGFFGPFRFLSNFHVVQIPYNGLVYPSTEAAYMSAKTTDRSIHKLLTQARNPSDARKIGKTLVLREGWDDMRLEVMEEVNRIKYSQTDYFDSMKLRDMLKVTTPAVLVEANWWGDTFWGECNGIGENNLGKILMKIRESL
jgi:ribA/ribD-fused uncharacterized protein